MDFATRAKAKEAPMGHPCLARRALDALDEKTRTAAITAIRDEAVAATSLADVFEEDEIDISVDQVRRHRTGSCVQCRKAGVFPRPER